MRSAEVEHQSSLNRTPTPARREYGNGLAAGGVGSMRADTIGGLALPLDLGRASRITRVEVDNLAMVDNVSIKLGRGLVAVTGETGTGKSLISSAFSLAAGARVRGADLVGSRGSTAAVQLQLELAEGHRASTAEVLERFGVPLVDGGRRLKVNRTVGGKGSSASVNGCSVKLGALRELMSPLIYTVDANAFELFSRADGRLRALDRMFTPAEVALADKARSVVAQLKQAEARRARLEQRCRFEGGHGGGSADDASLLHHWVEELDEFREGEMAFMDRMRSVVESFVDDWGEDMLGPLSEPFLSGTLLSDEDAEEGSRGGVEGLSDLWPRLSRVREGMEDLEASRTKVELARQLAVEQSNPESIAHAIGKIRGLLIDAEDENVGLSQDLLEGTHEDLNSLEDLVKSAGEKLERSVESLPMLPITLDEVEERTVKWRDLARKHGVPPERLGSMQAQLRVELDELVVAAEALPLAREKEERWRAAAEEATGELSAVRRRAALEVEQLVNPMMADVGLEGATFKVFVEESKTLGPSGADRVQFLMEANEGQTRGTVDAVASSGEKSRLLLLLETRLPPPQARSTAEVGDRRGGVVGEEGGTAEDVDADGEAAGTAAGGSSGVVRVPPCAVLYDEIDAHVGGRTAVAVGRLLANQGRDSQVVVVTHTASVAALADQHLVVDKALTDATAVMASAGNDGISSISSSSGSGGGGACDTVDAAPPSSPPPPPTRPSSPPAADGADEPLSSSARRSRRQGKGRVGVSVSIREVNGREREEELARMAAGDMGGGAAAELAREMLRYSRRQGS
ncbi:conserved unknown protein [Ectocarpus siliculosus]|uniref:DNA repair protein RecN n=1 Tax=Ectocarpus siliculosus TaxID=2880 RepID=D8LCA1_ECTSI|nr:conserved unknown protein [Ectocarpus siliculosus]|eukprot:CBN78137.1 conserved unknown protein [Ectocarpus siliculosus]